MAVAHLPARSLRPRGAILIVLPALPSPLLSSSCSSARPTRATSAGCRNRPALSPRSLCLLWPRHQLLLLPHHLCPYCLDRPHDRWLRLRRCLARCVRHRPARVLLVPRPSLPLRRDGALAAPGRLDPRGGPDRQRAHPPRAALQAPRLLCHRMQDKKTIENAAFASQRQMLADNCTASASCASSSSPCSSASWPAEADKPTAFVFVISLVYRAAS